VGLSKNLAHVTLNPSLAVMLSAAKHLLLPLRVNCVKGLLTLVESTSRRFFPFAPLRASARTALRMTRNGFFDSPTVEHSVDVSD